MSLVAAILVLLAAYLLGSLPTGYLAGRLLRGIDLREHGSHSTGATNVLRTLGKGPALVVLLVDLGKGSAAIGLALWFAPFASGLDPAGATWLATQAPWLTSLAGLAALVGHARPVWLGFRGGKSAATGLGVLLALAWPVGLGAALVWGVALALGRIVSLASILATLTAMVLALLLDLPLAYRLLIVGGGLYVIWRHRANIARLRNGTEPRLGSASRT